MKIAGVAFLIMLAFGFTANLHGQDSDDSIMGEIESSSSLPAAERIDFLSGLQERMGGETSPEIQKEYWTRLGGAYAQSGNLDGYLLAAERLIDLGGRRNDANLRSFGISMKINFLNDLKRRDEAVLLVDQAIAAGEAATDVEARIKVYTAVGLLFDNMDRHEEALDNQRKALEAIRESGKPAYGSRIFLLMRMAAIHKAQRNNDAALASLALVESTSKEAGLPPGAKFYRLRGEVHRNNKDWLLSFEDYEKAMKAAREAGQASSEALVLIDLADLHLKQGSYSEAADYAKKALALDILSEKNTAIARLNLGHAKAMSGSPEEGLSLMQQSVDFYEGQNDQVLLESGLKEFSEVAFAVGRFKIAYEALARHEDVQWKIFQRERDKIIVEAQTKFETEEKNRQIELLEKENALNQIQLEAESRRRVSSAIIAVMALVLLVSLLVFTLRIRRMRDQLVLQNARLSRYDKVVAHDLRSPVGRLFSLAEAIEFFIERKDHQNVSDLLGYMKETASYCVDLIQNLYENAIGGESGPSGGKSAEPGAALVQAKRNLHDTLEKYSAQVIAPSCSVDPVAISEVNLVQIFQNLIENSVKYRSAEPPCITVGMQKDPGDTVSITVTDNGVGIAPEQLSKVFDDGYQATADEPGQREGGGYGLASCKMIIDNAGGEITCNSVVGEGTIFVITLPLAINPATE